MLIKPRHCGKYSYTLHSPREVNELKSNLDPSKKSKDGDIAFELARRIWKPKNGGEIIAETIKETRDVEYISTQTLNREREIYQGGGKFRYSVGEQIAIPVKRSNETCTSLINSGVSEESIVRLEEIFNHRESLKNGLIAFHVVHLADSEDNNPYKRFNDGNNNQVDMLCCGVLEHKPYYELTPSHYKRKGWSQLMFAPKDLIENVAVLFPNPSPLFIYLHLCHPGKITT